jgi:hypothetical protein
MGRNRPPARRRIRALAAGFTLIELLVVVGIIIIITAMSVGILSGFLKGSICKHGGRILQGQFFKARQLAASKRMYHFLRLETTQERLTTCRIFEDSNLNRQFNPPILALPNEALNAASPDNQVGDVTPLAKGSYVGAGVPGGAR